MDTITFFLGMTKAIASANWIWFSDGSPVTWSIWSPVKSWHQCAYMKRNTVQGSWFDKMRWSSVECSREDVPRASVCEKIRKYVIDLLEIG